MDVATPVTTGFTLPPVATTFPSALYQPTTTFPAGVTYTPPIATSYSPPVTSTWWFWLIMAFVIAGVIVAVIIIAVTYGMPQSTASSGEEHASGSMMGASYSRNNKNNKGGSHQGVCVTYG